MTGLCIFHLLSMDMDIMFVSLCNANNPHGCVYMCNEDCELLSGCCSSPVHPVNLYRSHGYSGGGELRERKKVPFHDDVCVCVRARVHE